MRLLFILVLLLVASGSARADGEKLSAAEVMSLLNGNTAIGDWRGRPYRQYFAADGTTVYMAEGSPPSPGRWKVDETSGDYCSWWERSGWGCYGVERDGSDYVWTLPNDDYRGPFTVVEGRQP